jgi:uncharacterized membrane protein YphA (DoxX/SURF4 family)
MDRVEEIRDWLDARRDFIFEVVRIFLGIALFAQGLYWVRHVGEVHSLLERSGIHLGFTLSVLLSHYVGIAHIAGGLWLALGMATRLAAAIQVPVLLGAVAFVRLREGLFGESGHLQLAVLVLVLLLLCVAHGGGRLSIDHYLRTHVRYASDEGLPHW